MIPPQALHYVGLAIARAAGWGVGRLTSAVLDGSFDPEIRRLSKLDERSLLMEIAVRDNADIALTPPDKIIRQGEATVNRVLPKARALICPHRETLVKIIDSPEVAIISTVVGYLTGDLPGALVKPVATLLVKRGIWLVCGKG